MYANIYYLLIIHTNILIYIYIYIYIIKDATEEFDMLHDRKVIGADFPQRTHEIRYIYIYILSLSLYIIYIYIYIWYDYYYYYY